MMMTRADIKKFLLALPIAVILGMGFSSNVQALDCVDGQKVTSPCKCGTATCSVGQYCHLTTKVLTSGTAGTTFSTPTGTCSSLPVAEKGVVQKKKIADEYYADKPAVEIDPEIKAILEKLQDKADVLTPLEKLASFTGRDGFNNFGETWLTDSKATDMLQRIQNRLNQLSKDGHISYEQNQQIYNYAKSELYDVGAQRAEEATKQTGNDDKLQRIQNANETVSQGLNDCPTVDLIRAKYQAGCWSCLIVEKLSSAFMTAASKAYSLSQKAGLILLGLGSVLWLLIWGLRNVSSLTQLEPGNILNELIKFGFKVALAYTFIILGLRMVSSYFINPIMGVGAKIAESYWDPEKIKPYTQEYDWELTDEQYQEIDNVGVTVTPVQEEEAVSLEMSAEDKAKLALAQQKSEDFAKTQIPNFIIPPVFDGWLTSPTGCRFHPTRKTYANHKGLDIGTQGKVGAKIVASGPGKIYYANQPSGAGNYAKIIHEGGWTSLYFHMLPQSSQLHKNGAEVAQGQVIGFVGSTGASTGPHLHFEIKQGGRWVDPLYLLTGVVKYVDGACGPSTVATFPPGFSQHQYVPKNPSMAWTAGGEGVIDLTNIATGVTVAQNYSSLSSFTFGNIKYTGPTDIMSPAVMNSILGATKAIGDITSENMVLGDAIMCYASLDNGGAWHPFGYTVTNFWMWFEGIFIWCTGLLLTVAIAYYLLDLSFKIGFAVIALPIVVGLWPFDLTKDKFSICISIIAKSAATFAFLAITTTFTVQLTDAVYSFEDGEDEAYTTSVQNSSAPQGLARLYEIYDRATMADVGANNLSEAQKEIDINYASAKLAIFSTTFVLILFAFLYSYKLVQATVPDLVNKFFPDKAFGNQQPMHHWATAASRWAKQQAMKPVGWARDTALYQGGNLAKGIVGRTVGGLTNQVRNFAGKGNGESKTIGGRAARGIGGMTKGIGKAMSAVGLKKAGAAVQNAGQKAKDAGNAFDKSYNQFATRNKKSENGNKPQEQKNEGGKNDKQA